mmetsp:Transcript_28728/g.42216  ORF Transcript_28728/g.42216 Transcript_28728/m.42216 type:complete len:494 (-) Transcript_28728:363-1844(-)
MQKILRQRQPQASVAGNDMKDPVLTQNPESMVQRSKLAITKLVADYAQDYESVVSILINFGIVAALLLSILIGLLMTIPAEEMTLGDIRSLSLSSPHFRCHFANKTTTNSIEICSPNFTKSLFGTTNATVLCKDGPSLDFGVKWGKGQMYTYHPFWCAGDIARLIGGNTLPSTSFHLLGNWTSGCSASSLTEAYRVAKDISADDFLEYEMEGMKASDAFSYWSIFRQTGNCKPSDRLTTHGFKAVFFLMLSLFWDLYLLISVTFTGASTNSTQMKVWWLSGGAVGAVVVLALLLTGTIDFIYMLEYVVAIRFPSPLVHLKFKKGFMDLFIIGGLYVSLGMFAFHYLMIQLGVTLWPKYQKDTKTEMNTTELSDSGDLQPSIEIKEIQNATNRKLLQEKNLDAHTLISFLDDNAFLNSVLLEAGIKTPSDRLKIIMNLKTIEKQQRENREGIFFYNDSLPPVPYTYEQVHQSWSNLNGPLVFPFQFNGGQFTTA